VEKFKMIINTSSEFQLLKLPHQIPLANRPFTYRQLNENDVAMMYIALSRNGKHIGKHLEWVGDLEGISYHRAKELVTNFLLDPEREHYLFFLGQKFVGHGILVPIGDRPEHTQVILWVDEKFTGQGIGKRITRTLESIAFEEFGFEALFYRFDKNNYASGRIAEDLLFFPHCEQKVESPTLDNSGVWNCRFKLNPSYLEA
jgi:ribosomal protein S18 acetylase RimI-like enzyme